MGKIVNINGSRVDEETGEDYGPDPVTLEVGKSLEDLEPDDFLEGLAGTEDQMSMDFGSEFALLRSTVKLPAPPVMPVKGQYKDGDELVFLVTAVVEEVHFKGIRETQGKRKVRVGTARHHVMRVTACDLQPVKVEPPKKKAAAKK